jgi:hypothetical protein
LCAEVTTPPIRRVGVLPRLDQVRAVHPLRDRLGVGAGIDEAEVVRLREYRRRRCRDGAHLVGDGRQFARKNRQHVFDLSHLDRRAYRT